MKNCFTFIFLYPFALVLGQAEATFLDASYEFADGIYLSLSSFQTDSPDWPLDQLEGRLVTNDETGLTKSDFLAVKTDTGAMVLDLDQIWGISLDGIPYVRLTEKTGDRNFGTFAKLSVRGAICFFSFESEVERYVEVKAYNPLNGRPFRRGRVKNMEKINNKRILRFDTGEVAPLNRQNLLEWVKDDPQLIEAIEALNEEDQQDKLYRSILIYDDRHPVLINRNE